LEDGDKVVTRTTFHGTHRGDFVGIPPTGATAAFDVIDLVGITDGQIREQRNVIDAFGLVHQLGAA
jgi:predicted ester cyclase